MNQELPLVSVVLPSCNRPHRVVDALASVLGQTYTNLEVIVVDDGSVVPVEEVAGQLADNDRRVSIVRHRESLGPAVARNHGIDVGRGSLVAFLDDDDRWEPTKLERQVSYLADHPDTGLVSCRHLIEVEGQHGHPVLFRGPDRFDDSQLLWVNFIRSVSLVMVRRSLLASDLHFDPSFKSVEDWDLWLRCLRRTAAGVVPEPLVRYVVHREPRLTDTDTQRRGLDAFVAKYATEMSGPCRAFHQAHLRMESGMGWAKKAKVVGALMAPSPATPILIGEQVARQLSRLRRDPGLTERALARLIPT